MSHIVVVKAGKVWEVWYLWEKSSVPDQFVLGDLLPVAGVWMTSSGQIEEGSLASTALIFLSWGCLIRGSFRFHQETIVLSFHAGFAALATILSVIRKPNSRPLALKASSAAVRSTDTGSLAALTLPFAAA